MSLNDEQVRNANEPFPATDMPFLTTNLLRSEPTGTAKLEYEGDTEREIIKTSFISVVEINFFGTHAYPMALRLQALIQSSFGMSELRKMNTALLTTSAISELSGLEGAGYEERAKMDLHFTHSHVTTTPLDLIDEIPALSINTNY